MRSSRSSMDEFVRKEYILNKNVVHLIDDIFWNMPFKNPTQADRAITLIIFIMLVMRTMVIVYDYRIMLIMHIFVIILIIHIMVILHMLIIL